jgi:hypothetical protein
MSKAPSRTAAPAKRKPVPFEFVLDELASLAPTTRPMFGANAVYLGERMVLILRERDTHPEDNGVWFPTAQEHHASLRPLFPSMRPVELLGGRGGAWQILPADAPDFEQSVVRLCELVAQGDPRIGKAPKAAAAKKGTSVKKGASAKRSG